MTSDDHSVVITGIGLVTSLGLDRPSTWAKLCRGDSGASWLNIPEYAGFPVRWDRPMASDADPALEYLVRAADEAMADSGIRESGLEPERSASLVGLSKGGFRSLIWVSEMVRSRQVDDATLSQIWMNSWPSSGASRLSARYGFLGPCIAPVAACATGLVAALQGAELIRRGACDLALVGGSDASLEPLLLAAFRRMKALARLEPGSDPKRAVRPWDEDRSGFLVGEGAAVLVLERLDHAKARGASVYAELLGGALGSDAFHETGLDPDPSGLARVIARSLEASNLGPADIDAVNVHGTATRSNDPLECRAIRRAFGPEADRLVCSANKAQIGHLLGAAGSAELAISALSVRHGFLPPTLNLDRADPACDLDGTPHLGRELPIRALLKLSLGFGGHLAAAVLRRIDLHC
jgi:3-oxoacyl-[acyl-carrier-protein] synthase II